MVTPVVPVVEHEKSVSELLDTPITLERVVTTKTHTLDQEYNIEVNNNGVDEEGNPTVLHGEEADAELIRLAGEYKLPEHFNPTIILMGAGGSRKGFCTLPWWIFDWINQNPDWKLNPDSCPHYSARDTLRSLIYYIQRDGDVTVRETRNSGFHVLK